jgi:serine phosphatase RsbU (regulator of sigma subunit)
VIWNGMLYLNAFTVHELIAAGVMASVAVLFLVIYWKFGHRRLDLVYAALVSCGALATLLTFLIENIVPAGTPAEQVAGAAERTLLLSRVQYSVGLGILAFQLHFVFRYAGARNFLARHIGVVYVLLAIFIASVWSRSFMDARLQPIGPTSSWRVAVPFLPEAGPLLLPYVGAWVAVNATTLVLLYRRGRRGRAGPQSALPVDPWVRLSFVILAASGLTDIILAAAGWAGIATIPLGAVLISLMVAVALIRARLGAERQHHHLERELEIASRIQQALFPSVPPQVQGFELAGRSQPANQTGGDMFDFISLPGGGWLIALADAAGHGVGPALVISETRAYLRALSRGAARPGSILHGTDALLSANTRESNLVTCFVGLLEPADDTLSLASAGQGPIFFFDHAAQRFTEMNATCPPLGSFLLAPPNGGEVRQRFRPGDFLVVVSDGFYEAVSVGRELYGLDRLKDSLLRHRELPASNLIDAVWDDLARFTGPSAQADDLTVIVLRKT